MPDIEKCPAIMFMEGIRNRYDRKEQRSGQKWKLAARKALEVGPIEDFPGNPASPPCRFLQGYFRHKIFTQEVLRNPPLCPSIQLESRPAKRVMADTVF